MTFDALVVGTHQVYSGELAQDTWKDRFIALFLPEPNGKDRFIAMFTLKW